MSSIWHATLVIDGSAPILSNWSPFTVSSFYPTDSLLKKTPAKTSKCASQFSLLFPFTQHKSRPVEYSNKKSRGSWCELLVIFFCVCCGSLNLTKKIGVTDLWNQAIVFFPPLGLDLLLTHSPWRDRQFNKELVCVNRKVLSNVIAPLNIILKFEGNRKIFHLSFYFVFDFFFWWGKVEAAQDFVSNNQEYSQECIKCYSLMTRAC